jgi:HEAT repeat protein
MRRTRRGEIESLLEQSSDPDPKVRAAALRNLCPCHVKRNEPLVWDRVLELADDPSIEVRRQVFHLLGDGSPREREEEAVAAMERMTRDPDPKLRRHARKVMARYRRGGTINVL